MSSDLDRWVERQFAVSAAGLARSLSPVEAVKTRPGFGQVIRPLKGAIVAAPGLEVSETEPDYFFHWHRDSALIVDALRALALHDPQVATHFADFVRFNVVLTALDGRALVADPAWRAAVDPDFARFVRPDADLAGAHGAALGGETRFNPDGTLDVQRWGRPQSDGPALRALALLRWLGQAPGTGAPGLDTATREAAAGLVRDDVAFVLARWREPCLDIWEEELGHHYYTLRVQAAALEAAADRLGSADPAPACRRAAAAILSTLDGYWRSDEGFYRSRILAGGGRSAKELDVSVVLAAIHAGGEGPTHSVRDPRLHATLARLEQSFAAHYAINAGRPAGPAMGRYPGDVYISGGAWYLTTLGAAEFCFRAAQACGEHDRAGWLARGDAFLETVRAYTPADGALSEQFDQTTGAQTSAKHLAWSYAAFLTCARARRECHEDGPSATPAAGDLL